MGQVALTVSILSPALVSLAFLVLSVKRTLTNALPTLAKTAVLVWTVLQRLAAFVFPAILALSVKQRSTNAFLTLVEMVAVVSTD
jgi:hypothetical protein